MLTVIHTLLLGTALVLLVIASLGTVVLLQWVRKVAQGLVTIGTLIARLTNQVVENQERVMDAFGDIEQELKDEEDLTAEVQAEVQVILDHLASVDGGLTVAQTAVVRDRLAGVRDRLKAIRDAAAAPTPAPAPTPDPVSVPDGSGDSSSTGSGETSGG